MAEFDQITVATKRYVRSKPELVDNIFQHDPLLAYFRANVPEPFPGGQFIAENFIYDGLIGGSYLKGKEFNTDQRQVEQQGQFTVKYFQTGVTLYKEDIQVLNKGPEMIFPLIQSRVQVAYMTIGAHQAIGLYLNGSRAGYTPNWDGLAEAFNDNGTNSWDGQQYSTYGTITRGGEVGAALNSVPTNVNGAISYPTLNRTLTAGTFGMIEPNIGITTALGLDYIREKFQTQQRFTNTVEPKIGFRGLEFQGATLMPSRYAPGTAISGTAFPEAVTYLTEMSRGAITAYPTVTAETLFWINARKPYANMYISTDPEFSYGITGFKPAQGNTTIVAQVLFAGAVTFNPRYHQQLHGITG